MVKNDVKVFLVHVIFNTLSYKVTLKIKTKIKGEEIDLYAPAAPREGRG